MDRIESEIKDTNDAFDEVLLEVVKNQRRTNKALMRAFIAVIICYSLIVISMIIGFFWYESQFETKETVTTTETVTQSVDGENSEINNIEGNMYKDNAVHNEGE